MTEGRKKYKKLSTSEKEKAVELYFTENGITLKKLAQDFDVPVTNVRNVIINTCGGIGISGSNIRRTKTPKDICIAEIFGVYRRSSAKRQIKFELSAKEVEELIFLPCYYCNRSNVNTKKRGKHQIKYNGIDRIDNKIGYVCGNVVTCCGPCNSAKSSRTVEQFFGLIKMIYENHNLDKMVR